MSPLAGASPFGYRLCANYTTHNVCNWAIPADDPSPLCSSCRLTRAIPDPSMQWQREAWYKLEVAKRRLVYSLLHLRLPVANRVDDPDHGLAFEFLADQPQAGGPVLTGHADGVITINLAEADDAERERRRLQLHEPYRTLLGHFRHEVGHYYWERLIAGTDRLEPFRDAVRRRARRLRRGAAGALPERPAGRLAEPLRDHLRDVRTRGRTGPRRGRTTCT